MDLFNRLQSIYDRVAELRNENRTWNAVLFAQVDDVLAEVNERLALLNDTLEPERQFLQNEILNLQGNFFQLEADRVKEKFRVLTVQLTALRELLEARREFLQKLKEFYALLQECKAVLEEVGAPEVQRSATEIQQLTNDLSTMQAKLNRLGDDVCAAQRKAEINVVDANVESQLRSLLPAQIESQEASPTERVTRLVSELSTRLIVLTSRFPEQSMSTKEYIAALMDSAAEEKAMMKDIEKFIGEIPQESQTPDVLDSVNSLNEALRESISVRSRLVENAVTRRIDDLRKELASIEAELDGEMDAHNADNVHKLEAERLVPCTNEIGDLEHSLDTDVTQEMKDRLRPQFGDLELTAFHINGKIKKFSQRLAKESRKEQRLMRNLPAFSRWLDLMENDIKEVLASDDLDEPDRHTRLLRLKESCEQYKRLADKLERFPFENAEQADTIRQYCTRYRGLLEMFEQAMLPTPRVVPIHVESPPGSSMDMRRPTASAMSLTSTESVSEALTEGDEIDNDLASIESEVGRTEAIQFARQRPSPEPLSIIHRIAEDLPTNIPQPIELPIANVNNEVETTIRSMRALYDLYNSLPLKDVEQAKEDLVKLKGLAKRSSRMVKDLRLLNEVCQDEQRPTVTQYIADLKREKHYMKKLYKELAQEVEDEVNLRLNYHQLISELGDLEAEVALRRLRTGRRTRNRQWQKPK